MTTIAVRSIETPIYELNEDGEFRCPHYNVEIEPPCCSGRDIYGNTSCGCYGSYSVYCPDCSNEDLTESEVEALLDTDYSEPDYE